jgi:arylsulfatase A-like enzyme
MGNVMNALLSVVLAVMPAAPDVVLVSVDTLRADHLGCYGYARNTSPKTDRFAEEGLLFEDMVCEIPLTGPSFAAMLTSRYPRNTGATLNGVPISEQIPTVSEQFQQAGYQTLCVQSYWPLKKRKSGLHRGFDVYDDDFIAAPKPGEKQKLERYADEVLEVALAQLEHRDSGRPMFFWVHFADPHAPYRLHEAFDPSGVHAEETGSYQHTRRYDSEVAFMDEHLGRLVDALPKENTFVMFVADHGESLGEHDYQGHGRYLYQPSMHVPLIIRGPGIKPGRTSAPVRGVDIGVTLLAMAGLSPVNGMVGESLLNGNIAPERPRTFENRPSGRWTPSPATDILKRRGGGGTEIDRRPAQARPHVPRNARPVLRGLRVGSWKLISNGQEGTVELYELLEDPGELTDLSSAQPVRVMRMQKQLDAWFRLHPPVVSTHTEFSQEDVEALEALGYAE